MGQGFDHYIHAFHMPIFFFISGYLHKNKENTNIKQIIKKKAKSLLIPYFSFGIMHYLLYVALNYNETDNLLNPLKSLFWINFEGIPIAGALWFLTAIFFAEIVYEILTRKIKNRRLLFVTVAVISILGNVITYKLPYSINAAMVGVGLLFAGESFRKYGENGILEKINRKKYIYILLVIVNTILIFLNGYINMREGKYAFIPLFWINALMATIIWWDISKKIERKKESKYLKKVYNAIKFMGENSIVFLCLNQVVIKILEEIVLLKILYNQMFILELVIRMMALLVVITILSILTLLIKNTKLKVLIGR